MSSKLYQNVIQQMKDTTDRVVGILDESGSVAVCSDPALVGKSMGNSLSDIMGMNDLVFADGYTYRVIGSRIKMDNVVFVKGTDELAQNIAAVLSVSLNTMKDFYDEKYDKSNFIKNIMLERTSFQRRRSPRRSACSPYRQNRGLCLRYSSEPVPR